ncbi:IS110 family transposase [Phreatobacter stygius]|uniref:IS110 family transposase n=1 Tax=Phreatobacter stygius TaxID=1940610 RepID=A0A4D7B0N1_9HYPH|nr:IS110 family transposase [Phreatobacter stygius]QCI67219.1 IS110 family transposase [Phreatobacter stygius]
MTAERVKTAGISTAGATFELAVQDVAERWHAGDDRDGWRAFASVLTRHGVSQVGLELTGHRPKLAHTLRATGFTIVDIEPRHVRAYAWLTEGPAGARGPDASRIAALTALRAEERASPDPRFASLSGHLVYLDYAEDDLRTARIRRLQHRAGVTAPAGPDDRSALDQVYDRDEQWAEERAGRALAELVAELRGDAEIAACLDRLIAMPDMDERRAIAAVIAMPELLRLRKQGSASG